jgi:hypothetical protein
MHGMNQSAFVTWHMAGQVTWTVVALASSAAGVSFALPKAKAKSNFRKCSTRDPAAIRSGSFEIREGDLLLLLLLLENP